jgi:putative ABC transport system ATP-binding protein
MGPTARDLLLWAARRVRGTVALGALLMVTHQAAEAAVPVLIGVVIDRGVATGDMGAMLTWVGVLAALFVGLSAAGCSGIYLYQRGLVWADHAVRMRIAERALDARGLREPARAGELVSLATVDALRVAQSTSAVMLACGALAGILGGAAFLLATSVTLGLIILLGLPVVLVAVRALARPLERRSAEQHAAIAATAGVATDLLTGLRVVKGLGAERAGAARYRAASRVALVGALRAARVQGAYEGVTIGLSGVFLVVVAWAGGRMALEGTITIGELVSAVGLTQFLIGPLSRLVFVGAELARGAGSAGRIAAFLRAPAAIGDDGAPLPAPARGAVALRGVSHGPLRDVDLAVAPGEIAGIVADDPLDAAALLALLARSADPTAGEVLLDGTPLQRLRLDDVRAAMLVEPHDADLFGATEPRDAVIAGEDVPIGSESRALSGGQRQRVALARALLAEPPVLVLHDPTTAVDAATEHRIAARLRELRAGRTTLLVTTSPALLSVATRIVVLREGRVVAEGSHADLAAADEGYREAVLS